MFYEIPFRVFHVTLYPGLPYAVAAACVNVLSLWGVGILARQIAAVQPDVDRLTAGSPGESAPFRACGQHRGTLHRRPRFSSVRCGGRSCHAPRFFSALYRLHTQLVRAKSHYVAQARRLSAQAIAPVENTWSLDVLVAEAPRLNAAEALEKRAAAIQEWPIDETLFARVAALTTSVATAIVVRLILSRLGL